MLLDLENDIFVSAVSLWEIAIKHALARKGMGQMPISGAQALSAFRAAGYDLLPVTPDHAVAVESLPPIHGDPFDRLLVAQAISEPLRLITHDARLAKYSDSVIHV